MEDFGEHMSVPCTQGRNEGEKGGHNFPRAESLRGLRKVPTMSQVLSSIQHICFGTISGSNMGRQTCFLPRAPSNLIVPLHAQFWSIHSLCPLFSSVTGEHMRHYHKFQSPKNVFRFYAFQSKSAS